MTFIPVAAPLENGRNPLSEALKQGVVLGTIVSDAPDGEQPALEIVNQVSWLFYRSGMGESDSPIDAFELVGDKLVLKHALDCETDGYSREGSVALEVDIGYTSSDGEVQWTDSITFKIQDVVETVRGTAKSEVVAGDAGADRLFGFAGRDKLFGKQGDDVLSGGLGPDVMSSGRGNDMFVYRSIKESTVSAPDRITDFDTNGYNSYGDTINLWAIDANTKLAGNQAFTWLSGKAFTGHAGEVRQVIKASDTFVYMDVNGDRQADMTIRLDDPVKLFKDDFIL